MDAFHLSAESFPEDSILANLSQSEILTPGRSNTSGINQLETKPIISEPHIENENASQVDISGIPEPTTSAKTSNSPPPAIKTFTKSLNHASGRRIGATFKRSALPLSKKSASVDRLNKEPVAINAGLKSGGSLKELTKRGYEHVQSKVKADIDLAREHDIKRRSMLKRHRSMPEHVGSPAPSEQDVNLSPSEPDAILGRLREQIADQDRLIREKDRQIMQLNLVFNSSDREDQSKENLRLQRKIESMRMVIVETNQQNSQLQDTVRELSLKVNKSGGWSSTTASSYPTSDVHTNSSSGNSSHKNISYASSSGVLSGSMQFLSDDQFLLHRKLAKRSVDGESSPGGHLMNADEGIALFDKSHIDDCPIITSSSTSNEILELFNEADEITSNMKGKRLKRRPRATAKSIRKRLRKLVRYCTPCLDHGADSDQFEGDTSILYAPLDTDMSHGDNYINYKSFS